MTQASNHASAAFNSLPDDARDALDHLRQETESRFDELREKVQETMDEIRPMMHEMRQRTQQELDRADEYVRAHPYQVLGVAFALGAALGFMLSRR
jgi:ElaB/YqjD/DUF883 family membrane-anchored ribosome-binding protein